jgi:hypothetical protein
MPRLKSGATLRQDLGAVAYEYALEGSQRGFIGLALMPIFETMVQSANYPVIPIEALLKLQDAKRAARSAYGRSDYEFGDGTFSCKEFGWEEPVDDVEAAMYANFFDAEEVATMRAVDVLLRNQEKRIADRLTSTATFGTHNVSVKWDVAATATPRADVRDAKQSLFNATGLDANAFCCSKTTFDNILLTAEFQEATKYVSQALMEVFEVQKQLVAQYLGVDRVLVGNAVYDGAKKGQSFSATSIWSDSKGFVARVATQPLNLKEPCIGRTFLWIEDSPEHLVVEQYREEQTRSNIYRARHNVDEAFVFTGALYLMSNLK